MTLRSFESFFEAVHGRPPFPWQSRAAARLARREVFAVTVPTGLGKSSLVDAAVWAAAHGAWRRIAFVVDRRIVVDAVHQRAQRIAERLHSASDPGLAAIASRLGEMQIVRLRGGVFGDEDWVLYPERLTVVLTTVDQLGSRLLFRGYGVGPRRWPLHAGFFGSDTLVVVDEAHLSTPFLQTLHVLQRHGAGIAVVPMSATLAGQHGSETVSLQPDDLAIPTVQRRLRAGKSISLVEAGPGDGDFVKATLEQATALAGQPGVTRVAIIVNRVATARRCFTQLVAAGADAQLLTGRVRAAERDRQLVALLPRVEAGRERTAEARPLFVVATQTIEVGADFDFDAIVTECASLSALRQRFGRLDRLGERGQSVGVVVRRPSKDRDDPVYGEALANAWDWLQARAAEGGGVVDFGIAAFEALLASHAAPGEPQRHAASLLPTHLQMLAQTGPFAPQVEIGAWLHGPTDRAPDVTLVWRDDLDPDDPEGWPRAVGWLPPMLREGLPLPSVVARRWLTGAKSGDDWGDAGGLADDDGMAGGSPERPVLRWRGAEDCAVVPAKDIRPGDTVVLPAAFGGCDAWGWAPDSAAPVVDLADACLAERLEAGATRRVVLRLCDGHWHAFDSAADELRGLVAELKALQADLPFAEYDLEDELIAARERIVAAVRASSHPLAARLRDARVEPHPRGVVVRGAGTEEVEGAIETGRAVTLDVHHADVARWAARLAGDDPHAAEIVAAARVHDAGKAEPRMQSLLHGSAIRAAAGPVLAKSALRRRDEQLAAWLSSGLPRGFRHEFASLDFDRVDNPLVRHLTATHHGFGRPWLVPCADADAAGARFSRLDTHWLRSWSAMQSGHGHWGLARMEWLLRAADARASIEEAQVDEGAVDGPR